MKKRKKPSWTWRIFKFFGLLFLLVLGVAILGYLATPKEERQQVLVSLRKFIGLERVVMVNDVQQETAGSGSSDDPIGAAVLAAQEVENEKNTGKLSPVKWKKLEPPKADAKTVRHFENFADFSEDYAKNYKEAASGLAKKRNWDITTTQKVAADVGYLRLKKNQNIPWIELSPWDPTMKKLISKEIELRKKEKKDATVASKKLSPTIRGQEIREKDDPDLKKGLLKVSPRVAEIISQFIDEKGRLSNTSFFQMKKIIRQFSPEELDNVISIFEQDNNFYQVKEKMGFTTK